MGFGALRVINEDRIAPGTGFGTHGHRDMEIISYVLDGELAHKDSMGNGQAGGANSGVIRPGDVQRMSAGTGVQHSEFNHASGETTHFLQIWIEPNTAGIAPSYEQRTFPDAQKRGRLRLVASPDGAEGSVRIHADALMYAGLFDGSETFRLQLDPKRKGYVHVVRGELQVNGQRLVAGDAAMLEHEPLITLDAGKAAEVLVFDLSDN
jgi:redox-sensitive bicupin YhaK (pirin superfamily)